MKVSTLATEWNVHYRVVKVETEKLLKLFNTAGKRLWWISPGWAVKGIWKIPYSVSEMKRESTGFSD